MPLSGESYSFKVRGACLHKETEKLFKFAAKFLIDVCEKLYA